MTTNVHISVPMLFIVIGLAMVISSALVAKLDADMRKQHLEMQVGVKKDIKE